MNAFVKGIHAAEGTPVTPHDPKSFMDHYDDITLYLLHAKGALFLAYAAIDENFADDADQITDCLGQVNTFLELVLTSIAAITTQINEGDIYLKKINQIRASISLLINGGFGHINNEDVTNLLHGLYRNTEYFRDNEIEGLLELAQEFEEKNQTIH